VAVSAAVPGSVLFPAPDLNRMPVAAGNAGGVCVSGVSDAGGVESGAGPADARPDRALFLRIVCRAGNLAGLRAGISWDRNAAPDGGDSSNGTARKRSGFSGRNQTPAKPA
jgi:hypothetical protein